MAPAVNMAINIAIFFGLSQLEVIMIAIIYKMTNDMPTVVASAVNFAEYGNIIYLVGEIDFGVVYFKTRQYV